MVARITFFLFALFGTAAIALAQEPIPVASASSQHTSGSAASEIYYQKSEVPEGSPWDSRFALVFGSTSSKILIELDHPTEIRSVEIQADNNDSYIIEYQVENSWKRLWTAPQVEGEKGLVTRRVVLEEPVRAQRFRVRPGVGDNSYSVSNLKFYSEALDLQGDERSWLALPNKLSQDSFAGLKSLVPILLLVLILVQKESTGRSRIVLSALMVTAGLLGGCLYWNLFTFHKGNYVHTWDFSHYYIGGKYFRELRYDCLYDAASLADKTGNSGVVRNLRTNKIEPASLAKQRGSDCKRRFSEGRWESFSDDVQYFRSRVGSIRWGKWKVDHGFNAPPAWLILGSTLANVFSATDSNITLLAHLDSVFLVLTFLAILWGFGLVPALVAATFIGCNFTAGYFWTGGSFLRMDWLFYLIGSICCLRKGYYVIAGCLLSLAIQVRVFPVIVLLLPAASIVAGMFKCRSIWPNPQERSFIVGGFATLAFGLVLSSLVSGGFMSSYQEFAANSALHLRTSLTNDMGLVTVLSQSPEFSAEVVKDPNSSDPFGYWKEKRLETFQRNRWYYYCIVLIVGVLAILAAIRRPLFESVALGVGLIPFLAKLTCYYYVFFAAWALLGGISRYYVVALLLVVHLSWVLNANFSWYDSLFVVESILFLVPTTLGFLLAWGSAADLKTETID